MRDALRSIRMRATSSFTLVVLAALVVGLAIAPFATGGLSGSSSGTVAVIPIEGTIDGERTATVTQSLETARNDDSIVAVVLVANSGGGGAAASEELYMQVQRTADEMPVVASVDAVAASGAYYAIAPSEEIYVKPASQVGSVGVLATLPPPLEPNEDISTTGPAKLSGGEQRALEHELETLRGSFVNAIFESRGDRLDISEAELSYARTYAGHDAIDRGLADTIGDRQSAVEHAATSAGIDQYDTTVIRGNGAVTFVSQAAYVSADTPQKESISFTTFIGNESSGPVVLLMQPELVTTSSIVHNETETTETPIVPDGDDDA